MYLLSHRRLSHSVLSVQWSVSVSPGPVADAAQADRFIPPDTLVLANRFERPLTILLFLIPAVIIVSLCWFRTRHPVADTMETHNLFADRYLQEWNAKQYVPISRTL